jgi:thioredoxin-dependent peroxiredoxin
MLKIGTKVENFSLLDANHHTHQLYDYLGKKVVIYFYPKDDTPGCTAQACGFRDRNEDFVKQDVVVIGISADSPESHQKFISKYNLPFILLSDPDHKIAEYFGTWVEKSMYGKKYMGISRSTFVLDQSAVITHVFEKASPGENAQDILAVL